MSALFKRTLSALLVAMLVLQAPALAFAAEATGSGGGAVRVGWVEVSAAEKDSNNLAGYQYEYLQALAQYTGWSYENVTGTLSECLAMLDAGQIDMLGFLQKTEARDAQYEYPELPMATTSGILVALQDSSLSDGSTSLNGITVAIDPSSANNDGFADYCIANGIQVNYKEYPSNDAMAAALDGGEVDAAVTGEDERRGSDKIILRYAVSNEYLAVRKGDTALLEELNKAQAQLSSFYPSLNSDLHSKYFSLSNDGKPLFTAEEEAFIAAHQNILVKYDSGWPPVEYLDETTGTYKGISPELFARLSEKCGINFVYEGSTSGQVLDDLLADDTKNVVTTISFDYAWAESHNVYITQPFITSAIVKLGRNVDAKDPTVAINEKAYFTYALQDVLEDVHTVNYSKQSERLEAVRSGKADYTFVTKDQANYYRSIPKYSSLTMEEVPGYEQQICISIAKNSDPELISILSKSIASISHDEMNEIVQTSTVNAYKLTFWDKVYQNRLLIICAAIVLATLIAAFAWKMRTDREKQRALQKVNSAKSDFLAHVSHDIRTPLNAIIGISSIATAEDDPALVHSYLEKINESSKYLLGLINDTLDMSKIENGKLTMHLEAVNFEEVFRVMMAVILPKAQEKHIDFVVKQEGSTGQYFMADKFRLEQVFLNLLNNAIKFTPDGGTVTCEVAAIEVDEAHIKHRISISDTGVGMSKEFMDKLYEPFEQEHNRLSIENAGTGLGLSIVKSIVDLMGGTISCTSEKNVGTTFAIEFPSQLASQADIEALRAAGGGALDIDLTGRRVLLAEDNDMNVLVAQKMLERKSMQVTVTKNGRDALAAFSESEEFFFDVILMDIHMPFMTGLEAARAIRALDRSDARSVPIIALSANAFSEDVVASIEAGMNGHLAKPIDNASLFDTMARCLGQAKAR